MLSEEVLERKAIRELARIYGREYVMENFPGRCIAYGINHGKYYFFCGFKGSEELPDREADEKGWVVCAELWMDAAIC